MSTERPAGGRSERLYRFSLHVTRRADLTEEQFSQHWRTSHPPLVQEWLQRYGILKYTQYHTPASLRPDAVATWPDLARLPAQNYDGVVEITVRKLEDFYNARNDPFYSEHVIADEEKMIDRSKSGWTIGWEEIYIKDGEIVNLPQGDTKDAT